MVYNAYCQVKAITVLEPHIGTYVFTSTDLTIYQVNHAFPVQYLVQAEFLSEMGLLPAMIRKYFLPQIRYC